MNPDSNSSRWQRRELDRTVIDFPEQAANDSQPRVERVPMWLFFSGNRRLVCRSPVEVEVSPDEESGVLASCERLHVFAAGASYQEAIDSLHEQVVHFYEEYTALGDDDVVGRAVEIRRLYCEYFELLQNT